MTRKDLGRELKGKDVVVFWTDPKFKGWYEATVRSFNEEEGLISLRYRKDKTRETVDPTLMYIPEGRIGFIEERDRNHQLLRGELDVSLLDIKGRTRNAVKKAVAQDAVRSKAQTNTERERGDPAAAVDIPRGTDSPHDCLGGEGEGGDPMEEGAAGKEQTGNDDRELEMPLGDCLEKGTETDPGRQHMEASIEFGYDGDIGDDRDDRDDADDADDADHMDILVANENEPSASKECTGPSDDYVPDSYDASPVRSSPALARQSNPMELATDVPLAEHLCNDVSEDQPSMEDPWQHDQVALIYRWLTASLAHPLSKQAKLTTLRPSLREAVDFIADNVRDTIEKSFNNSILVIGAPGSGKTLAVSRVCSQVQEEWNRTPSSSLSGRIDPKVGIVRLSGIEFSDERAAFREIARQLCDSLNLDYVKTASLGDNIQFLLQILKALAHANKAALFILEEFDLFAHTQKQTFLYCLLDSLQKSQAKAVVIGTTCRHDCLDLLEKRVKSRFSHRSVTLTPPTALKDSDAQGSGAKSILTNILSLPEGCFVGASQHNDQVQRAMDDRRVLAGLQRIIQFSNSIHTLSRVARKALGLWYASRGGSTENVPFRADHLVEAINDTWSSTSNGFETSISKLCPLDLTVLAAAHKAKSGRSDGLLNFEMIYHEFKTYTTSNNLHVDNYSRTAASKSFERLIACGLLRHPRNKGGSLSRRDRHFAPVLVQVTRAELQQGLHSHFNAPRQLVDWALRGEIHTTAINEY